MGLSALSSLRIADSLSQPVKRRVIIKAASKRDTIVNASIALISNGTAVTLKSALGRYSRLVWLKVSYQE